MARPRVTVLVVEPTGFGYVSPPLGSIARHGGTGSVENGNVKQGAAGPVIDAHTHYFPPSAADAADSGKTWHGIAFGRNARGKLTSRLGAAEQEIPWPMPLETPAARLHSMAARRIDTHAVSLSPTMYWHELPPRDAQGFARAANDELAAMVAAHPGRYLGLGYLPLQDPKLAVAELERCARDLRFPGVMVCTHVNGQDWDDDALFPVLQAAEALNAVVYFHPAQGRANAFLPRYHLRNLIGNPLETTVALAALIFGGVLDRLPRLKACFAHAGGYGVLGVGRMDHGAAARPEAGQAARLPSDYIRACWFDTVTHGERALRHVIDAVGADKLVLGSDYPADMGEPDLVSFIESCASLSAQEKSAVLHENAARLFALDEQGAATAPSAVASDAGRLA